MTGIPGKLTTVAVAIAGLALAQAAAGAAQGSKGQTYRWVDKDGVVHFGDHLPPEAASTERHVLNDYGIAIDKQEGARSAEEIAAEKDALRKAEEEKQKAILTARRDQVLLDTYLSVEEIEELRDRRIDLIDTQIKVTENYLAGLRAILQKLQGEAAAFKPYSDNPDAPPIEEKLARELSTTMDSVLLYETNLASANARKTEVIGQFASDIERFRELKGIAAARN